MPHKLIGLVVLLVMVAISLAPPALAQTTPPSTAQQPPATVDVRAGRENRSALWDLSLGGSDAEPAGQESGSGGTGGGPPVFYARFYALETLPGGSQCLRTRRRAYPTAVAAAVAQDTQNILLLADPNSAGVPPCPATNGQPATTPTVEAALFWRTLGEDMLPTPSPRIAPGYMLAGKLAYLEAGSQPTARFEHPTPLGLLVIDATSKLVVDWGDGSGPDGPHAGPGAPWPNGTITHSWTTARTYDIQVVQKWTASWALGADKGTLDGLETRGLIDNFEVRQLQAVRNR